MGVAFVSYVGRDRHWSDIIVQELTALGYAQSVHELDRPERFDELKSWLAGRQRSDDLLLFIVSGDYPLFTVAELLAGAARPRQLLLAIVSPVILPPQAERFERCELFGMSEKAARARLWTFLADRGTPLREASPTLPALPIAALMRKRAGLNAHARARPAASAAPQYSDVLDAAPPPQARGPMPAPPMPSAAPPPSQRVGSGGGGGAPPKWTWLLAGAVGLAVAAYLARHQVAEVFRGLLGMLPLAAAAVPLSPAEEGRARRDRVDASAFAPPAARAGEDFLVQIFLHAPGDAATTAMLAREADGDTGRRGVVTLEVAVEQGQRIDVVLEAKSLEIDEPSQSLIWRGDPRACQFMVSARAAAAGRSHQIRARLAIGGIPVGSLRFVVQVTAEATAALDITGEESRRYTHAFLSHAHEDRVKVLTYAQLLEAAGIKYFQDIATLHAMEDWEKRLHEAIDQCDLFLLFWTASAAQSQWVERETRYAMQRQGSSLQEMPDIAPIFLDPDPPHPPEWLRSRHFDSILRLAMRGAAAEAERKRGA